MENFGREVLEQLTKLADATMRLTVLAEKQSASTDVQPESPPPTCPHCNMVDPQVALKVDQGEGPMSEMALTLTCQHCQRQIIAAPLDWVIFSSRTAYEQALQQIERTGGNGTS